MGLIDKKVGDFSIGEAFAVGLIKTVEEPILAPFIGNATVKSGAIKMVGAYAIPTYLLKNKFGRMMGTALAVDAVEDIIIGLLGNAGNSSSGSYI